jgi:hypothetical protein
LKLEEIDSEIFRKGEKKEKWTEDIKYLIIKWKRRRL